MYVAIVKTIHGNTQPDRSQTGWLPADPRRPEGKQPADE